MCKTRDIRGLHKGGTVSRLDQETILAITYVQYTLKYFMLLCILLSLNRRLVVHDISILRMSITLSFSI